MFKFLKTINSSEFQSKNDKNKVVLIEYIGGSSESLPEIKTFDEGKT
jgi:hypothetical protein